MKRIRDVSKYIELDFTNVFIVFYGEKMRTVLLFGFLILLLVNAQLTDRIGQLKQRVLGETRKEVKALLDLSMDAMKASAIALKENNQRRRENIRRDINPAFKELYDRPKEESTWLLGADFQERVKDLSQNKSLGQQLGLERRRDSRNHYLGQSRFSPYGNRYHSQIRH